MTEKLYELLNIIDDVKQKLTDQEYKSIMELMPKLDLDNNMRKVLVTRIESIPTLTFSVDSNDEYSCKKLHYDIEHVESRKSWILEANILCLKKRGNQLETCEFGKVCDACKLVFSGEIDHTNSTTYMLFNKGVQDMEPIYRNTYHCLVVPINLESDDDEDKNTFLYRELMMPIKKIVNIKLI